MRTTLRLTTLLALAAILSGCAASGSEASSSAASPTSAAPVTPIETIAPEPEAAAIVVSGSGFEIVDSDGGALFSHAWPDEVAPAVAALEQAFGTAPAESFEEGDNTHLADMNLYDWDGFVLADAQNLVQPRTEYAWPSTVTVTVASIGGIDLRTIGGVAVGDPVDDLTSRAISTYEQSDGVLNLVMDPVDPNADAATGTTAIYVRTDAAAESVASLFAPGGHPGY